MGVAAADQYQIPGFCKISYHTECASEVRDPRPWKTQSQLCDLHCSSFKTHFGGAQHARGQSPSQ
jgi:hypothetical protein